MAAFYTTRTTTTHVGLALGKIFISRLAHYNTCQYSWQEALQLREEGGATAARSNN